MGARDVEAQAGGPVGLPEEFRAAGTALFSAGLVRGSEGNLSAFDGETLVVTRTRVSLGSLSNDDLIVGRLDGEVPDASSDVAVHRAVYAARGPGAVAHAHPPGTVPDDGGGPGAHGVYSFAPTLAAAVALIRDGDPGNVRFEGGELSMRSVVPVEVCGDAIRILDQRRLPLETTWVTAWTVEDVARAIADLAVRGAPLLGVAAAFGMALAAEAALRTGAPIVPSVERAGAALVASRPTAVNVRWAVERVLGAARPSAGGPADVVHAVREEARAIAAEDERSCGAIARFGAPLLRSAGNVLTHCNTGALATYGVGTALGVIGRAHADGEGLHVWVSETRPVLQGARLTAWELQRLGVPMTLIADGAAGSLMAKDLVDAVIVGADRIAANGDTANKVGTYPLAVLADRHAIPFYVAAPMSTVDPVTPTGAAIVVEERPESEVVAPLGAAIAPPGTRAANPAFDVTPAGLITAIVTDRGVARPPFDASLGALLDDALASGDLRRPA